MKRWLSLGLAIGLGIFAFVAGCSSQAPEKIRIGEVTRSVFYAPQYVAIAKGFFLEEGL
ncbi:MAG: ABC transporter substrate-binding protein, partial [Clostridia bacterium]